MFWLALVVVAVVAFVAGLLVGRRNPSIANAAANAANAGVAQAKSAIDAAKK